MKHNPLQICRYGTGISQTAARRSAKAGHSVVFGNAVAAPEAARHG